MAVENTISVNLPNILTITLMWVVGIALIGGVIVLGKKALSLKGG
jgi:hypothetical protein